MKKHFLLATTFAASLAFAAQARADFTIGIIAPLTGPDAADGSSVKRTMQAAADAINSNGGIRGDKLVLKFGDDASDPLKSSSIAQDFLDSKINFVIEVRLSDLSEPLHVVSQSSTDIMAEAGIGIFLLMKEFPKIDLIDGGRTSNLSNECYRADARQGVIAANYVVKNFKDKKIAIVDDSRDYGKTLVDAFKTALNRDGVTEALEISLGYGSYDYIEEAEKAKKDAQKLKNAGVEVIYYGGVSGDIGVLQRQLEEISAKPQIIGGDALSDVNYQTFYKKESDGTVFTDAPRNTLITDLDSARTALKEREIPIEDLTLRSFAAVHELASAIRDELCYGYSEFSLITDIEDGKPTIYIDPRAIQVRISSDPAIPAKIDKATGNRTLPSYSFYQWKAGKIVPIAEGSQSPTEN
ncbi:hypothetical protein BJF92_11710 [Rhizobium rhizosphaerae]|uniref:Leucine-binding protein domain-containing protein n=1 Tax=Xaviernesmea rhizosphaerae TaxID=1672749 RepID=A0A1Q9AN26_9HYPH|nr:branched-chain amino acid ABC transporter substrate-binding protein [Xaviernesmea rhizosphaerae]OLP56739.1 hypothetical protein BJF92_11710 [Xaviernesmea rhizosphaerae]